MAGGLSRPSAERFVQRAGGQVTSSAVAAKPPPMPMTAPPPIPGLPAFDTSPLAASPPPLPAWAPPPVPVEYQHSPVATTPHPARAGAAVASSSPKGSINVLKLAGGGALLVVGVALLALSLSASGRIRLKVPIALVFGGGATLAQAIRER